MIGLRAREQREETGNGQYPGTVRTGEADDGRRGQVTGSSTIGTGRERGYEL